MLFFIISLAASVPVGFARELPKTKPVGSISHSILNLGKMDINLYLNAQKENRKALEELFQPNYEVHSHGHVSPKNEYEIVHPSRPQPILRYEPFIEGCPCSNVQSGVAPHGTPDLLSKILMNNDLFSFRNDPERSSLCCGSHEQIHEEFIIEFDPKPNPPQAQMRPQTKPFFPQQQMPQLLPKVFPYLPFLSQNFQSKAMTGKPKSKQIEVLLFPNKKGLVKNETESVSISRADIQVVGDKKTNMLYDIASAKPSVKKDLTQAKVDAGIDAAKSVKAADTTNQIN